MAEYPQKPPFKVQMRHIHFGSQITHLEVSTKTNHPLNRTLVIEEEMTERSSRRFRRYASHLGSLCR